MAFYEKYVSLCNSVKKSPSGVALEIGLSKTAVNGWKHGRSNPTDATKQKLADYFGCSISELTGEMEQKEKPSAENDTELDETTKELVELAYSLDEEDRVMLLEMARSIKKRRES